MPGTDAPGPSAKQKAIHEFWELAVIFSYLAFFFCALATYSMLLLREFHVKYLTFAFALINAFVITKIILIGELAHLGRKHEGKPLYFSAIYKSVLFTLLVFAFHFLEEAIKGFVHRVDIAQAFQDIRIDDLLGRSILVLCIFLPLFAFREIRRVLGEDRFRALFFHSRDSSK